METRSPSRTSIEWAEGALVATAVIAVAAKITGSVLAPGSRGVLDGRMVNLVETSSGALAYVLTALLVSLVCAASFELARAQPAPAPATPGKISRVAVVAVSGLVVALASPAVVERLGTVPSLALALVTSLVALVSGIVVLRAPHARAVGGMLTLLAVCGLLRVVAWEASAISFDHDSMRMHGAARIFATAAVLAHALSVLVAGAWLGTRSRWRGRILANVAILCAFVVTWLAARTTDAPSALEAILRATVPASIGSPAPLLVGSVAAFLLPWSVLLAAIALLERSESRTVTAALALAVLSQGAFDVPLHALLVTASAQWAMLAMTPPAYLRGGV